MRHALGVLGILAAGVLLAVSAAMNWSFGFSLGRTEIDGQIYGAASAAADVLKALVPFFFFAAIRSRMWSQAIASAVVGLVVVAYSLTSALGHAALNRFDTAGKRAVAASTYKDLRADLARAQEQAGWIPQHRPLLSVQADIDAAKTEAGWRFTKGCNKVTGPQGRKFCQKYHSLTAELASADQGAMLEMKIADLQTKLGKSEGNSVMSAADPQAAVLAKLSSILFFDVKVEDVQTALTVFIALLLEVGSGLGMYVAFSQWRLYDRGTPRQSREVATQDQDVAPQPAVRPVTLNEALDLPAKVDHDLAPEPEPLPEEPEVVEQPAAAVAAAKSQAGANDNRSLPQAHQRLIVPESDVERFYKESVEPEDGSSLTATALYESYCAWCEEQTKEPLALPTFGRQFGELGVQKAKVAGRIRYIGIALKTSKDRQEDKNLPAFGRQAA
jgi:hypothetical protein